MRNGGKGSFDLIYHQHCSYLRLQYDDGGVVWFGCDNALSFRYIDSVERAPLEELYLKSMTGEESKGKRKSYIDRVSQDSLCSKFLETLIDGEGMDEDRANFLCVKLISQVKEFLPGKQSSAGSQNVYVECTVDGWNDCLTEIESKLS